jgi:hypothetical protein
VLLSVFGEQAYPRLDVKKIIGRHLMEESRFIQSFIAEGEIRGERKTILKFLANRFGKTAVRQVADEVNAIEDSAHLDRLVQAAADSESLDQFRKALAAKKSRRST